ncbi:MAG: formate dehydrogenase accessory sulfurtransferase FdhD [Trueperaceae bacterium]
MSRRPGPSVRVPVVRLGDRVGAGRIDRVVGEEPLQIRMIAGPPSADGPRADVAITLRTPGHDFELAAGFLFAEGLLRARDDLIAIRYCAEVPAEQRYNVVHVHVRGDALPDLAKLERHFTVHSACGVCGKAHLDALEVRCDRPLPTGPEVPLAVLLGLPDALRAGQALFESTGGLHAAGAFAPDGRALAVREDVGRHNAFDKLLGWALLEGVDLEGALACVSGRASYELLQKAVAGRFTVFAAVSAPSSMAIDVARRFGVTLAGFVRGGGCSVYAGAQRVASGG